MPRLDYLKEYKAAIKAGVTAAAPYSPTTNWEIGIPIDSAKQLDRSHFTQTGVGAGAVIVVYGSMVTKFDNPTPSFDILVPVTNGNILTSVSGTLKKQRSTEQLTFSTAVFGGVTTKVHLGGSGISNTANETWDFKFTYTLT
jgi:hypothetical protein